MVIGTMETSNMQKRNGHIVGVDDIRRKCFHLINIINGNKWLTNDIQKGQAELVEVEDRRPECSDGAGLLQLYDDFYRQELSRLSLNIAVMFRIIDDQLISSECAERYKEHRDRVDVNNWYATHEFKRFSIREACNKIIHASEFKPLFDIGDGVVVTSPSGEKHDVEQFPHLTGEMDLVGKLNGNEWSCTINIQPFIEIIIDVLAFEP